MTRPTGRWADGRSRPRSTSSTRTRCSRGQHPAGRDPGRRDRGRDGLSADDRGRELCDRPPPRRRDHQSFGATEETFPNAASIYALRSAYFNALVHRVTVLAAAGDGGATDEQLDGVDFYPFRVNAGRHRSACHVGRRDPTAPRRQRQPHRAGQRLERPALFGSPAAGGGGVSAVFSRPFYQDGSGISSAIAVGPPTSHERRGRRWRHVYMSFRPPRDYARATTSSAARARPAPSFRAWWPSPIRPPATTSGCSTRRCTRRATARVGLDRHYHGNNT